MVAPPRFELGKGTDFESAGCAVLLNPRGHNGYCSTTNYLQGSLTQAILLLISLYRTYEVRTVVLGRLGGS